MRVTRLAKLAGHHALRGISIKVCCQTGLPLHREEAHAHIAPGRYRGMVCFESWATFHATNLTHELAHILSGRSGEGEHWGAAVRELGGRVERRYRKR